VKERVVSQIFW